jgi:hypothetical protein
MFVSLRHRPGHAQADFGEARVVIRDVEQKAHFFALDLPNSDACYVRVHPAANTEAWLAGHVHSFAFFGAVLVLSRLHFGLFRAKFAMKEIENGTEIHIDRYFLHLQYCFFYIISPKQILDATRHPLICCLGQHRVQSTERPF